MTFAPQVTGGIKAPHFVFFIKDYLEKSYNIYTKLIESSSTLAKVKGDKLIQIDFDNDVENIVLTPIPKKGRVDISPNNIDLSITDD